MSHFELNPYAMYIEGVDTVFYLIQDLIVVNFLFKSW